MLLCAGPAAAVAPPHGEVYATSGTELLSSTPLWTHIPVEILG